MRVLYFIESLAPGGKERRLVELIFSLVKDKNYECEVVLLRNYIHYKKILDVGIKVHILERRSKKDFSIFWKFYQIAKNFKPNIIHTWGNIATFYSIPAKLVLAIPLVNSQITDAPLEVQNKFKFKINFFFSDKIVANTKLGLKMYNVNPKKSTVIYNGFDFERTKSLIEPNFMRKKLGIQTEYVVGMIATFSQYKDYTTYINAALSILKVKSNISFLCVGSGNSKSFESRIPSEFNKSILFLGEQDDIESIINICNVGVLTSFGEGISNALLEFMALGKPIVATNLGGTPELVRDKYNGFLIKKSDSEELFNKIIYLLDNEKETLRIGQNNIKTIKEKFSIDNMTNAFLNIYNSFMK